MQPDRYFDILLVEDNAGDVGLTRQAFKDINPRVRLHVARDGYEALEFLQRRSELEHAPRPHLILLDLNMPRMGGAEFLSLVKMEEDLRYIPIIVLTTSNAPADVINSYRQHACCHLTKPVDFMEFVEMIRLVDRFWLGVAHLPVHCCGGAA